MRTNIFVPGVHVLQNQYKVLSTGFMAVACVLVGDKAPDIGRSFQQALGRGFECFVVATLDELLLAAKERWPSVAFVDALLFPRQENLEQGARAFMREWHDAGFGKVPIVITYSEFVAFGEDQRALFVRAGAKGFLPKPLDTKELSKWVGPLQDSTKNQAAPKEPLEVSESFFGVEDNTPSPSPDSPQESIAQSMGEDPAPEGAEDLSIWGGAPEAAGHSQWDEAQPQQSQPQSAPTSAVAPPSVSEPASAGPQSQQQPQPRPAVPPQSAEGPVQEPAPDPPSQSVASASSLRLEPEPVDEVQQASTVAGPTNSANVVEAAPESEPPDAVSGAGAASEAAEWPEPPAAEPNASPMPPSNASEEAELVAEAEAEPAEQQPPDQQPEEEFDELSVRPPEDEEALADEFAGEEEDFLPPDSASLSDADLEQALAKAEQEERSLDDSGWEPKSLDDFNLQEPVENSAPPEAPSETSNAAPNETAEEKEFAAIGGSMDEGLQKQMGMAAAVAGGPEAQKIIEQQAQKAIEEVVWKVVPELAERLIERRLNALLKEHEKDLRMSAIPLSKKA